MDFHQLLAKMQQLDTPVSSTPVEECGEMPMPNAPAVPPVTPPSMSVNLNAQGMDNIEDLLKLITKVNPDAAPKDAGLPSLAPMPGIGGPDIEPKAPGLGNLDAGPLKMLPDLDADNDHKVGGEEGPKEIDIELDGDDDADQQPDDLDDGEEKEEEAFGNSAPGSDGPETKDSTFSTHDGNDLNKSKKTFPKVAGGDNPMQKMESGDLRAQIRAELLQRLEEAKGAK